MTNTSAPLGLTRITLFHGLSVEPTSLIADTKKTELRLPGRAGKLTGMTTPEGDSLSVEQVMAEPHRALRGTVSLVDGKGNPIEQDERVERVVGFARKWQTIIDADIAPIRRSVLRLTREPHEGVPSQVFSVDSSGLLVNQSYWQGKPFRLIGFSSTPEPDRDSLMRAWQVFLGVRQAVNLYPVLADWDGRWATYPERVTEAVMDD